MKKDIKPENETEEKKEKKFVYPKFWAKQLKDKIIKKLDHVGDRIVAYTTVNPVKKQEMVKLKKRGSNYTNNHSKKSTKTKRAMSSNSRRINR